MDEDTDMQDPALPPDWYAWETAYGRWHARPGGTPDPAKYVHGASKQECAELAWNAHNKART